MEPGGLIFFIFLGCCTNVFFMEILIKQDPGIGTLVTFTQYLFNSIYGFIFSSKFGTKKPEIKLSEYVALVLLLFAANICNNCAFLFNISMPLHMIFKSGSLTANLILGMMILKRSYSNVKIASVITITIGIAIFSVQSGSILKSEVHNEGDNKEVKSDYRIYGMDLEYMKWLFGVSLLLVALFLSARMGIYQEVLFKTYGRHSSEALFYTHLLPLPAFLVIAPDLLAHWHLALHSPIMIFFGHEVPSTIFYLAGNVLTQFVCISSVYALATQCTSLTVTFVVTLRKFFSLVISIAYFHNAFNVYHWFGTMLIIVGTIAFSTE